MKLYERTIFLLQLCCIALSWLLPAHTNAITVIRADIEIGSISDAIDIGLFEKQTPLTVSNFKTYINDGDYENVLVYRNAPGFVVQTGGFTFDDSLGGFTYDSTLGIYDGGLHPVESKGSIPNEFKLANKRGSVAMALLSGQPDSATNEWYINLANNVEQLDIQNGGLDPGFTVFGEILGDGMDVVDRIAALQTLNFSGFNPAFSSFPVIDYILSEQSPEDVVKSNLVIINSFSEIYEITTYVNYGEVPTGNTLTKDILIVNRSDTPLVLGNIDTSGVTAPFSILSNPCENMTLMKDQQCIIKAEFSRPAVPEYFNDQFDVNVTSENRVFTVLLTSSMPDVDASVDSIDFGVVPISTPDEPFPERTFPIYFNRGDKDLLISSIKLDGADQSEFEVIDNCTTDSNMYQPGKIAPGGFCSVGIVFKPSSLDEKFASLSFFSDDPDTPELIIPLHGGAAGDSDGVPSNIEDSAPNDGDGNNDDLPDRLQDNVASFTNVDNSFTTLITSGNGQYSSVETVQLSTLAPLPDNVPMAKGAFTFELKNITVGSLVEFGLVLSAGNSPIDIYSFSGTADNSSPHWFALAKNTSPGAVFFGNASLYSPSNTAIRRNLSNISIQDGGDGDADMTANGTIVFVGGPAISNTTTDGSGAMLWLLLIAPLSVYVLRKAGSKTARI